MDVTIIIEDIFFKNITHSNAVSSAIKIESIGPVHLNRITAVDSQLYSLVEGHYPGTYYISDLTIKNVT